MSQGTSAQITQQVRQALNDADIDLDVFLMIPASGDAVATFGTVADPCDELWKRVTEIVSSIVGRTVGLDRTRCREVICATTHDHQPSGSSVSRTPIPTPALQASGAGEMKYRDIEPTISTRFRLPSGYPVLAEITIEPADWFRFEQLVGDTEDTRIIGHDDPQDGWLTVHVACGSDEVKNRLHDGWD